MKSVSGKRFAKLAEDKGWRLARINGSLSKMSGTTEARSRWSLGFSRATYSPRSGTNPIARRKWCAAAWEICRFAGFMEIGQRLLPPSGW
jgi:hypothetical protein